MKGPPPLAPFGLVLCHDGRFLHEGEPIGNRRLREHFERHVAYLPDEKKYVVRLQHFRGEVVVQEAAFFVREVDVASGELTLSDGTREKLDAASLHLSTIDGALLCRVKHGLEADGLLARFTHAAQAELFESLEEEGDVYVLPLAGERVELPPL